MTVPQQILIETDNRGRANLSKFGKNARFLATQEMDGTVILQPAEVITAAEARLHRNPEAVADLKQFAAEPDNVQTVKLRGRKS